jgi:hypothetical protein
VPLLADPIAGVTSCPAAGVIAAAANVTTKRKSRCMLRLLFRVFRKQESPDLRLSGV